MAAYAALVSLMNDLELILNHPCYSFSFENKQITSLSQSVHVLIDFMESYDSHGCSREAVEVLESRIASAAHAAHDVIESHVVDQIHAGSTLGAKAKSYFLLDLQRAIDSMDFIKRKARQYNAKSGFKVEQPAHPPPAASAKLLTSGKNLMVGFEAVIRLMEMLTGEPSSQRVIPIVGMGGIGKTTLAKNAYEHLYIKQHFDICLWATISLQYSAEKILSELLGKRESADGNVNRLGEQLHKNLWGRRYFIILDDMWSIEAWDEIQMFFPDNGNGSCVIVTTRLSKLAAHLSSSPFEMNFLDEDKSWELFCSDAFGEEDCPPQLEEIGKKIVKRCGGLPLSIIVIGGHLRKSSRMVEYWEKVANLMNPILSSGEDEQCFKILSLSYHHLPVYLKPCFLYMGIFPQYRLVKASELVKLWVVEGFLKPKKATSLEEVAEDYLNDLIGRNLILIRERSWNGKAEICHIHDVVRELCLKIAKKERFMCVLDDTTQDIGRERRIVIQRDKQHSDIVGALELAPLVRSLIRQEKRYFCNNLPFDFRLLRLSAFIRNGLRTEEGGCFSGGANFQQVNLRYLSFDKYIPTSGYLPWSILLFWNLQTLIIEPVDGQVIALAPYEIWKMTQLRHLEVIKFCLPDPLPCDSSNQEECIVLRNLHTLVGVVNFKLKEEVCKRMPNIKELCVWYDHLPADCEASSYYCPHNLGRFNKLESLKCFFGNDSKWRDFVLRFTFPSSLQDLSLVDSQLNWEELTMVIKSLPNLGALRLDSVNGLEWSLVEEEFPLLKFLNINGCYDLMHWNANSSHFPVLEILNIWEVPKLSGIPFDIGEIATLKRIVLAHCSMSAAISAMRIVVEY